MFKAERALKKLGIATSDLLANAFRPAGQLAPATLPSASPSSSTAPMPVACVTDGSGSLNAHEFGMFWSHVNNAREAANYLDDVLKRFAPVLEKEGTRHQHLVTSANAPPPVTPSAAAGTQAPSLPVSPPVAVSPMSSASDTVTLDAFLTTLNFITLCMDFNIHDVRIKKWLDGWAKSEGTRDCHQYRGVKDAIRMLVMRVDSHDIIGPLIIGCSTLHTAHEFQRMQQAVTDQNIFPSHCLEDSGETGAIESCFYYSHLLTLCQQPTLIPIIVQNTINKMLTLPQQMRMNPKVAETTLCALIHMIKGFLAIQSHGLNDALRPVMATIAQFYHWPQPYGALTLDLLHALHSEAQWPGEAMRQRIMSEALSVAFRTTNANDNDDNVWAPALFYFHDGEHRESQTFARLLELARWRTPSWLYDSEDMPVMTAEVMVNIILNLLHYDGQSCTQAEIDCIRALNAESMVQLFNQAMELTRDVTDRVEDAREVRAQNIEAIKILMAQLLEHQDTDEAPALNPSTMLIAPYIPTLPPCHHLSLSSRLTYEMLSREQLRLLGMTSIPFPTTPFFALLCSLLNTYKRAYAKQQEQKEQVSETSGNGNDHSAALEELSKLTVRVVVAGGDEMLHSFLCAYLLVQQQRPELLQRLTCQFLVVPFKTNHLASFIAKHDSWYHRHVFAPFRAPAFVLPSLRLDIEDSKKDTDTNNGGPVNAPGAFYRQCVEQYAKESDQSLELIAWQVECWLNDSDSTVTADHVIPFLQRVEVTSSHTRQDVNATPPEIIISHRKVALTYSEDDSEDANIVAGNVSELNTDDAAIYSQLLLSIVPWPRDPLFTPQPSMPALHYHSRLHRSYQRSASKVASVGTEGRGAVQLMELKCVQSRDSFNVNIDGQTFGPYHRVRVQPIRAMPRAAGSADRRWATFPVQTVFPITF